MTKQQTEDHDERLRSVLISIHKDALNKTEEDAKKAVEGDVQKVVTNLAQELAEHVRQSKSTAKIVASATEEVDHYRQSTDGLLGQVRQQTAEIKRMEKDVETYKNQSKYYQEEAKKLGKLGEYAQTELADIQTKLEETNVEHGKRLGEAESTHNALKEKLRNFQEEIDSRNVDIERLQGQIEVAKHQQTLVQTIEQTRKGDMDTMRDEMQKIVEKSKQEVQQLQMERAEQHRDQLATLSEERNKLETERDELIKRERDMLGRETHHKEQMGKLKGMQDELDKVKSELERREERLRLEEENDHIKFGKELLNAVYPHFARTRRHDLPPREIEEIKDRIHSIQESLLNQFPQFKPDPERPEKTHDAILVVKHMLETLSAPTAKRPIAKGGGISAIFGKDAIEASRKAKEEGTFMERVTHGSAR
jgi:hypothetical protein